MIYRKAEGNLDTLYTGSLLIRICSDYPQLPKPSPETDCADDIIA